MNISNDPNVLPTDEQEKHNISYQGYKFTGGILIFFGLIFGIILYNDFVHRGNPLISHYFTIHDKITDLASALVGTTGVLWTLASTILFFYSLIQTKQEISLQIKEMHQTNESLISQKNQTTFFNLLENHTRLINTLRFNGIVGHEGISKFHEDLLNGYKIYRDSILFNQFDNYTITGLHPFHKLHKNKSAVESYFKNLNTIIKFINFKLVEQEFYFELVYNYLSVGEKFLIGSIVNTSSHLDVKLLSETKGINFLYEYYNQFPPYRRQMKHFPYVDVRSKIHGLTVEPEATILSSFMFMYRLQVFPNIHNLLVELKKYEITVFELPNTTTIYTSNETFKYNGGEYLINCDKVICEFIETAKYSQIYILTVAFTFQMGDEEYIINDEFNIQRTQAGVNNLGYDAVKIISNISNSY